MLNFSKLKNEQASFFTVTVVGINQEGTIQVATNDDITVDCFIISAKKDDLPEIAANDSVAFFMEPHSKVGYILGIINRYIPVKKNTKYVTDVVSDTLDIVVDDERVNIEAKKEIQLKCGDGSINLRDQSVDDHRRGGNLSEWL